MYSLVVLLSVLASASFALAFVRGERRQVAWLGRLAGAAALHAHLGPVPRGVDGGRVDRAVAARAWWPAATAPRLAIVLAALYAPWLPSVLSQAAHTAAPWAERPSPLLLLGFPGGLFGYVALPLLIVAVFFALRRRPPVDRAVRVLAAVAVMTVSMAWVCSQIQPAWATRYLAVVLGPVLLALAVGRLARRALDVLRAGRRRGRVADERAAADQEQRAHGLDRRSRRRSDPGDLVVATQPEQVPALYRYLPEGVVYRTPIGLVLDPRQTDWRNGLDAHARRAGRARAAARRRADGPRAAGADRHARGRARASRSPSGRGRCGSARASGARRWRPRRGCGASAASRRSRCPRTP